MEGFKDECLAKGILEIYAWLQSMGGGKGQSCQTQSNMQNRSC
jgi:hypothetical protein